MVALHAHHGTADMQKEAVEERTATMRVGSGIQIRLVTSLLKLLSCEIPLGESTLGPLGYGPTTPRFQTLVQGLCLLASSVLIWERTSMKQISSHNAFVPSNTPSGQEVMSEWLTQIQGQWREREVAWSFCYKSLLQHVGPAFLKLLRGESVVGSVITG